MALKILFKDGTGTYFINIKSCTEKNNLLEIEFEDERKIYMHLRDIKKYKVYGDVRK